MIAAVGALALAWASQALADPSPVVPADDAEFIARADPLTFRARDSVGPAAGRMDFFISRVGTTGSNGVLSLPIDSFYAGHDLSIPPVYEGRPGSDTNWPHKPGTYYWQPVYHNCGFADPNCFGPIRSLTIEQLPPPGHAAPADDATIPYGEGTVFSIQDVPAYNRQGTHIYIEFSKSTDLNPDGRFASRDLLAEPVRVEGGTYKYRLRPPFTERPGTYYWIVERFDCLAGAPSDCYVSDGEIRSFTVAPRPEGGAPNTTLTRHPRHRTRKRRVRFAFSSSIAGASFECFYTGGWRSCRSPQTFRRLKPGRYRFKVRAVANEKRDPTPAKWLFRVLRRD